jgi:plastocyanin
VLPGAEVLASKKANGVSMAATGNAPLASWRGLLEDGVAYCEGLLGPSVPAGWADRRRAQLASGDSEEVISAAEDITRRLGGPDGGEYRRWLEQSVGQLTVTHPEVPEALGALGVPLATTNYDGLLEQATGLPAVTWRQGAQVEQALRNTMRAVLHLRGHWDDPASVVLGIRNYEAVLGDTHAKAMRNALAATRTLVFVGYGAGQEDPNFAEFRPWLAEVFAGSPYRHYRLGLEAELKDLWREHGLAERIVPLAYGTRHEELAPFLRSLGAVPSSLGPTEPAAAPGPNAVPSTPGEQAQMESHAGFEVPQGLQHDLSRGGSGRRPLRRWARRLAVLAALSLAALTLTTAASGAADKTVKTKGDETFVPNSKIMATLKFAPGHVVVNSGDTLTLQHDDKTQAPHTLSIVDADEVPTTIDEVFVCEVCEEIFDTFPEEPTGSVFLNAPDTGPGIDGRLDTLFVLPGDSVSAQVTAPAGSTLPYLCAIHPWMLGEIEVQ